ncbi:MAG: hypothetical protein GX813_01540 [Erysipelotrichia bacterium]|nr:hypothetical protein [Erysipelotrichia bacterium]
MDTKTSKILSIIAAGVIFIAFFLPWIGSSASAWDIVEQLFSMLAKVKSLPEDIRAYLPFLLIAFPVCSAIVIINNAKSLNDSDDTTKSSKVVTIIVFVFVIITLLYAQSKNPFSDFSNIFDMLGIGFYLTLIGVVYYLVDIVTIKTKTLQINDSSVQTELYCSNCGKKYNLDNAGEFCEECGNKL